MIGGFFDKGRCSSVVVFPAFVEDIHDEEAKYNIYCDRDHILDELDTLLVLLFLLGFRALDVVNDVVIGLALVLEFVVF